MLIRLFGCQLLCQLSYNSFELVGLEPTTRWLDEEILIYATAKTSERALACFNPKHSSAS